MKVIIEADGGSRGNPGIAGSGTLIYNADRSQVLKEYSYVVGKATNNVAEYHGLLNGLRGAAELGATEVSVRMDSKLVVEQMSGRWKIKHPDMKELALECKKVASSIGSVSYEWIPRSENSHADALANKAMDALAEGAAVGFLELEEPAAKTDSEEKVVETATSPAVWNGATTQATRFVLLRHGQTAMSAARQYSGRSNPELTSVGLEQACRAAAFIGRRGGIDAIVASPLQRCQQTAHEVSEQLGGMPVRTIDGLIEMDFGQWDGLSFSQAHEADPELHSAWLDDSRTAPPGGESLQQVHRRVKKVREELERKYAGKTIVVVSHVTPIKSILRQALDASASMFHRMHLDLASISVAEFYSDGPTCVRSVNDTHYLYG
ncbi:bifunctional RNase H/acid phosphatase [Corynebacterium diphtheriae]|uniref:bifunctional RNase H/acid phosphatase n=1 Tax=Corynebacterium diphtheriae TaxID=1717 RepID=UPI000B5424FC|nr:bifunctional RNase H/acid phosphatase [Corynebacterium diphtheriae]OWY00406.1 bifunctional RNase H/acid phosphatase [Corynebacterium diphtheriae]